MLACFWFLLFIFRIEAGIESRYEVQTYDSNHVLQTITETLVSVAPGEIVTGTFFNSDGSGETQTDTYTGLPLNIRCSAKFLGHIAETVTLVNANADVSTNPDIQQGGTTNQQPGQPAILLTQRPNGPVPSSYSSRRRLLSDSCGLYYCDPNEDAYDEVWNVNAANEVEVIEAQKLATKEEAIQAVEAAWAANYTAEERVEQSRWAQALNQSIYLQSLKTRIQDQLFTLVTSDNATGKAVASLIANDTAAFNMSAQRIISLSQEITTTDITLEALYNGMNATAHAVMAQNANLDQTATEMANQIQAAAGIEQDITGLLSDVATDRTMHDAVTSVYHSALTGVQTAYPPRVPLLDVNDLGIPPRTLTDAQRFLVADEFVQWFPYNDLLFRWSLLTRCDYQIFATGSREQYTVTDFVALIGYNELCSPPVPPANFSTTNFTLPNCANTCWVEESISFAPFVAYQDSSDFDFFTFQGAYDELVDWPPEIVDTTQVVQIPVTIYMDSNLLATEAYAACNTTTSDPTGANRRRIWSANNQYVYVVQPRVSFNGQVMDACVTSPITMDAVAAYTTTFPALFYHMMAAAPSYSLSVIQQMRIYLAGTISNGVFYTRQPFQYSQTPTAQLLTTQTTASFLSTSPTMMPVWLLNPVQVDKGILLESTSSNIQSGVNNDVDLTNSANFIIPKYLYFVGYPECLNMMCDVPGRPDLPQMTFIIDAPLGAMSFDQNVNSRDGTICGVADFDTSSGPASIFNKRPILNYTDWTSYNGGFTIPSELSASGALFRAQVQVNGPHDYTCVTRPSFAGLWCTIFDFYTVDVTNITNGFINLSPRDGYATLEGTFQGSSGMMMETSQQGCPSYFNLLDNSVDTVQIQMKNLLLDTSINATFSIVSQANSQLPPIILAVNQPAITTCFGQTTVTLAPLQTYTFSMPACGNQILRVLVPSILTPPGPPRTCFKWQSPLVPAQVVQLQQQVQNVTGYFADPVLARIVSTGEAINSLMLQVIDSATSIASDVFLQPGNIANRTLSPATIAQIAQTTNQSATFQAQVAAQAAAAAAQNQLVLNNLILQEQTLTNVSTAVSALSANIANSEAAVETIANGNAQLANAINKSERAAAQLATLTSDLNHTSYLLIDCNDPNIDCAKFNFQFWQRMGMIDCNSIDNLPPNPNCQHWYDLDHELCGSTYGGIYIIFVCGIPILFFFILAIVPGAACASFRGAIHNTFCKKICPLPCTNCQGKRCPTVCKKVDRKFYDGRFEK